MWFWWWLVSFVPRQEIDSHLLGDEGEVVIDEVRHHPVVFLRPIGEVLVAALAMVAFLYSSLDVAWFWLLVAAGLVTHAGWIALVDHMDRFVITNMRVFRISGVFSRTIATMPISRILDITVVKPLLGRFPFDYGHFVFESAAQEQGLRDIRYVGRPHERDLTIQRVVQRSGLRGPRPVT